MSIRQRVPSPPSSITGPLGEYLERIAQELNKIPVVSFFSGTHPNSKQTGYAGDLCINVSPSSSVSRMFIKYGSTTTRGQTSWNTVA